MPLYTFYTKFYKRVFIHILTFIVNKQWNLAYKTIFFKCLNK